MDEIRQEDRVAKSKVLRHLRRVNEALNTCFVAQVEGQRKILQQNTLALDSLGDIVEVMQELADYLNEEEVHVTSVTDREEEVEEDDTSTVGSGYGPNSGLKSEW